MFPNSYVPTLAIRPSEMRGLEFLPKEVKNRITPCILLAPWVSSKSLKRAIERVERAFPNRQYFLDIDRDYQHSNSPNTQAQQEFNSLSDSANWIEFIKEGSENLCPCIQFKDKSENDIKKWITTTQDLGRRYCMRIERNRFPKNFDEIVSAFAIADPKNFTIILEGGWTRDAISLFSWFEKLITKRLQKIHYSVPVVVSCTSIPKIFTNFIGINSIPFHNRHLMQQIQEKLDRHTIIYGDWGSTRPRENSGGGPAPDRIDYPVNDSWYIIRNPNEKWDFKIAARRLILSDIWDANLDAWGAEMIRRTERQNDIEDDIQTDSSDIVGINSLQQNTATRINIHLHRQALYEQKDLHEKTFEDEWED